MTAVVAGAHTNKHFITSTTLSLTAKTQCENLLTWHGNIADRFITRSAIFCEKGGTIMHAFCRALSNFVLTAVMVTGASLVAPTAEATTILFQTDDAGTFHDRVYVDNVMVIDQLRSSEAVIGDFPLYTGSPGLLTSDVNVAWNIYDLDGTTLSDTLSSPEPLEAILYT